MSEAALAPTMGPITEEELAAIAEADVSRCGDDELWNSLDELAIPDSKTLAFYILVRARRAGAKLEDLL